MHLPSLSIVHPSTPPSAGLQNAWHLNRIFHVTLPQIKVPTLSQKRYDDELMTIRLISLVNYILLQWWDEGSINETAQIQNPKLISIYIYIHTVCALNQQLIIRSRKQEEKVELPYHHYTQLLTFKICASHPTLDFVKLEVLLSKWRKEVWLIWASNSGEIGK